MKSTWRQALCLLLGSLLLLASIPWSRATDDDLRVLLLKHRLPDEVIPAIRTVLGPGESVSGVDTRLVVRATPETLGKIERLLTEIDTPRRNLRISVQHTGMRETDRGSVGASGVAGRGNTRIIVSNGKRSNTGASTSLSGPAGTLQVYGERRISTAHGHSAQNLTVLDGAHAFLRVGESIPQVQPFLALVGNRLAVIAGIQYYDVTTGFEVQPKIRGENIQLTVTPQFAFRSNQGTQDVNFQELRTEIIVKPGEWTDLGSVVESNNEINRQILGAGHSATSENTQFLIRVDPL